MLFPQPRVPLRSALGYPLAFPPGTSEWRQARRLANLQGRFLHSLARSECPSFPVPRSSAAGFAFGVGAGPVLEFVGVEFAVEVGDALGKACLRIRDSLVVDDGSELFEEEVQQEAGGQDADGIEVFFKVALKRRNGCGSLLLREFEGDHGLLPARL